MGSLDGQAMLNGFIPNGLLHDEATSVTRVLDRDRWSQAEERTAELIGLIQPNQLSDERRNAVVSYVQHLIMKCFPCQVFTFGSVPLKTYLPDGDIDLTAFGYNKKFEDSWAHEVLDILQNEEKSRDAEFCLKEAQYIQAEVKIIKCLVENIVVDISFNQLGGLCTLCFLEEVDRLISQNHLFKRSIILIKAWCYYESRILGAHHGLISSYALEILVLYIFHVYNKTFAGPLEVLYRFLEFFSKFDWDNYCLSLWGPVPVGSLPYMRAEQPRKDCGELLLSKSFLNNCSSVYAVMPNGQEIQEQRFVSKYLNIIDPLRANNNLGRSVSKGNFFRIRSAFTLGAQRLVRLLDCPEENLIAEFDLFFRNTWDRHAKDHRPDAPGHDNTQVTEISACHESEVEQARGSHAPPGVYLQHANHIKEPKKMFGSSDLSAISHTQSQNTKSIFTGTMTSGISSSMKNDEGAQGPNNLSYEVPGTRHFARAQPSPEFTHISGEFPSQHKHSGSLETEEGQSHSASSMDDDSKRSSSSSEVLDEHSSYQSSWKTSSDWRSDNIVDFKKISNSYSREFGLDFIKDGNSIDKATWMQQGEQDNMNYIATYWNHSFSGYLQSPMSGNSTYLPYSVPQFVLPSGYTHTKSYGMDPANIPSLESLRGHNMPYSQGLIPVLASQCFPSVGMTLNQEEITEPVDDNSVVELDQDDSDGGFWYDEDVNSVRGYDNEDGYIHPQQLRDNQMVAAAGSISGNSSWLTSSDCFSSKHYEETIENRWLTRENCGDDPPDDRTIESDVNSIARSRLSLASHSTSRTDQSSGSFSNGSPSKASKSARDRGGIKTAHPTLPSAARERQYEGILIDDNASPPDNYSGEWIRPSTVGSDMAGSITAETVTSDAQTHQSTTYGRGPIILPNSSVPITPVNSGSRQRAVDCQEPLPFAFYPTVPLVPFYTKVPLYGLPAETVASYSATNPMDTDAELGNFHEYQYSDSLESTERLEHSDIFNKSNHIGLDTTSESFDKQKSDILNGDFPSHWQNLQYGRFCQNAQLPGTLPYFPSFVPPMFLRGQFIQDGPRRPSTKMNVMAHGPHVVPMMQIRHGSNSHVGISWHFADEIPKYCSGTGTYLPKPRYYRNKHYSYTRNDRGSCSYYRKDQHGERNGNWNFNSKPRYANRGPFRYQVERPGTRMDKTNSNNRVDRQPARSWNSYEHGSFSSCNSYNGSFNSSISSNHVASNVPYGILPSPVVSAGEISTSESALPSTVMLYACDQNLNYDFNEWLEFVSVGPVHCSGTYDRSHQGESSHSAANELANLERESAESSQPSPPNVSRV